MKAVVQRVLSASVDAREPNGDRLRTGAIERGLLVYLGVGPADTTQTAEKMAQKLLSLRIFTDDAGKMSRSVLDINGAVLVVSQFTLFADTNRGNRPSFTGAAPPQLAEERYEQVLDCLASRCPVGCGRFGADMHVTSVGDGPVTISLEVA